MLLCLTTEWASGNEFAEWKLFSPDKKLAVIVSQKSLKSPYPEKLNIYYRVELDGKVILRDSPLGIKLLHRFGPIKERNFISDLEFLNLKKGEVHETYPMISGKKSLHINHANEMKLTFRNPDSLKIIIEFSVYNDGMAFRYVVPDQGKAKVIEEISGFRLPEKTTGWLQPYISHYENFYEKKTSGTYGESRNIAFPALFEVPETGWVLLTEAAVYGDYAASHLFGSLDNDALFRISFPGSISVPLPPSPMVTPWRVAVIGENPGTIVESVIVDNLNPPSEITDTSWISPGRAVFPWWSDNLANNKPEEIKSFVDFAVEMGFEWIEFDNGLVGSGVTAIANEDWMTSEWVPRLVQYATRNNIHAFGWQDIQNLDTAAKRHKNLSLMKEMGYKGVKVDFVEDDSQWMMKLQEEIIQSCLEYKLMVSFHGSTIPRGQRRRWPHIMTWEAVKGAEWYILPGSDIGYPSHNCILPFTRNVLGPMDYTPVAFSAKERETTLAHELALTVIFESAWQCIADSPESILNSPAKDFIKEVPAAWDDIRFLDGYPGEFVCLARRKGNSWFIAGINSSEPRDVSIPLHFTNIGTDKIRLYIDSDNSESLSVKNITISKNKPLQVHMNRNGGFCAKICP